MREIALFSILGLGSGALIAGLALSLVLSYRGSGVVNVGAGGVAMVSMYSFWALRSGFFGTTFSLFWSVVITLVVVMLLGLIIEKLVFRPLATSPPLAKLIGSLGVLLVTQSAMQIIFGPLPKQSTTFLPTSSIRVLGMQAPIDRMILAAVVVALTVGLWALYRWSRFGLQTRAAFESEQSAIWVGLSPAKLSLTNTLIASGVAGAMGVLASPIITVEPNYLPLVVVPALAAALFANFTSFFVATGAGLLIGMGTNVLFYAQTLSWYPKIDGVAIPGVQELLVFVLVVIALLWRGASLPRRGDYVERQLPIVPRPMHPLRSTLTAGLVCAIALVVLPFGFRQALLTGIIGGTLICSLVVISGYMGQVSIMQLTLSGVSGFVMANLAREWGIGFPAGPIIGVLVATGLGLLTGLSAIRVRGIHLAIATLAAATALEQFWFNNPRFGGGITGARIDEPFLFGFDIGSRSAFRGLDGQLPSPVFGFVALIFAMLVGLFVANLRRSRLGQQMIGARSNERAAAALGVNVRSLKLVAFGLSSFIAGIAGVMYAYNFSVLSANRFSAMTGLAVIAYAYIGGITMVRGAVIGGLLTVEALIPYAWESFAGLSGIWAVLIGGLFLIFNMIYVPEGLSGQSYRKRLQRQANKAAGLPPPGLVGFVVRQAGSLRARRAYSQVR